MTAAAVAAARTSGARWSPRLVAILAEELGELPGEEPWRGEVLRRAAGFQRALRAEDADAMLVAGVKLVGLGEGSTPAGDDYLVGVLHALALGRGRRSSLLAALVDIGESRTTTTSAAWLAAAARGEASPVWRSLLDALASGDEMDVGRAARAVRGTGHTSGAFSLRGFLDTVGD